MKVSETKVIPLNKNKHKQSMPETRTRYEMITSTEQLRQHSILNIEQFYKTIEGHLTITHGLELVTRAPYAQKHTISGIK